MRSAVKPVPEIDTIVASQSSDSKVIASGGIVQDVCGVLNRVVQDPTLQSPLFIAVVTFYEKHFVAPQTLIFAVIVPHTVLYSVCLCLIVGSEHIAHSNATSSNKTFTLFSAGFTFHILSCV